MKYRAALGLALFMLAFAPGLPLLARGVGDCAGFLSDPRAGSMPFACRSGL